MMRLVHNPSCPDTGVAAGEKLVVAGVVAVGFVVIVSFGNLVAGFEDTAAVVVVEDFGAVGKCFDLIGLSLAEEMSSLAVDLDMIEIVKEVHDPPWLGGTVSFHHHSLVRRLQLETDKMAAAVVAERIVNVDTPAYLPAAVGYPELKVKNIFCLCGFIFFFYLTSVFTLIARRY